MFFTCKLSSLNINEIPLNFLIDQYHLKHSAHQLSQFTYSVVGHWLMRNQVIVYAYMNQTLVCIWPLCSPTYWFWVCAEQHREPSSTNPVMLVFWHGSPPSSQGACSLGYGLCLWTWFLSGRLAWYRLHHSSGIFILLDIWLSLMIWLLVTYFWCLCLSLWSGCFICVCVHACVLFKGFSVLFHVFACKSLWDFLWLC